jgi:diguanylate cyclase (GGDEF)-like protein
MRLRRDLLSRPSQVGRHRTRKAGDIRPVVASNRRPAMQRLVTARQVKFILIALALVANGLVIAVVGYSLRLSRASYEQRAELLTQNLSAAIDRNVSANIEKIDLALLGLVDELERQSAHGGIDDERSIDFLKRLSARFPEIESIRATDDAGRAWLGPGNSREHPLDLSTRGWFQIQRARHDVGLYATKPIQSRATGGWIVSFSRRYLRPDGSFAGAVTAAVPVEFFRRMLSTIDVGKQGAVVIRDSDLGLVARLPAYINGQPTVVGSTAVNAKLRTLVDSGVAQATYHARGTAEGLERTITFRRLNVVPLIVIVGVGSEEYLQDWWNEVAVLLALSLVFAVITSGGGVFFFRAILRRSQAEERMLHMANHDALTRLPNRVNLQGRLEQAMASARRGGRQLAVLFIDLDRFKNINDTLGHAVGDELLKVVAQRLRALLRESDAVARLGGDEFVVVLTDLPTPAASPSAVLATKIIEELGRPYEVLGHVVHSTPSVGIAVFPDDGADGVLLMKNADAAMYHAKAAGRNNFQFFAQAMNDAAVERLELENGLRDAVTRHEFRLHYQPQIDVASNEVVGVEALVRWQHPELGLVPPLKFITLAEETGLIVPIGEWVLGEALRQLAEWRAQGMSRLIMSVNISAHQLSGAGFVDMVLSKLAAHDVPAAALKLEITESVAMQRPEVTVALLRELRQRGVGVAIDDFGTGYSSLSYLKQLPLNCLKLDRSFVRDIETDANDAAICAATISLAHSLGLAVVAEGVETTAQFEFLRSLGCDSVQGYFFSRPLPAPECASFVDSWLAVAA